MTVGTGKHNETSDAAIREALRDIRDTMRVLNLSDSARAGILVQLMMSQLTDMGFLNVPQSAKELFERTGMRSP